MVLLVMFMLSGCQPDISVSTASKDTDLSTFHPEIVHGDGFSIQPDVRVFTLFAYLNGPAGWSEESDKGFSPQRKQLRADLQKQMAALDPKVVQRWRDFYQKHKQISYCYLYYTLTLGAPPKFNYITSVAEMKYPEIVRSLDGFNSVLSEFYQQAGIQMLYEKTYREVMMAEVRKYDQARILSQIAHVYDYLRLDRPKFDTFDVVIVPAPFDSYWDANALIYTKRLYIVEGLESNDYGLNTHEYLHMLMDNLIPGDLAGQKSKLNAIYHANRKAPYVKNYQDLHTYVEENLVRALDHRMRSRLEPSKRAYEEGVLSDEVANGLVLEDNFYQSLEQFVQSPGQSAQEFITETLKAINETSSGTPVRSMCLGHQHQIDAPKTIDQAQVGKLIAHKPVSCFSR